MIDRSIAPAPQKSFSFKIPEIEKFNLENGISVSFIQKEKLPIVYFELLVFAGSKFDPDDKKGLSNLTSLLIDEGAAEYDAIQLSDEFKKLGTVFSVISDHDTTVLSFMSLKENFERSLQLLAKIFFLPRFEEKDFEREKKKVLNKILQLKDEPDYIASSVFEHLVFGNSQYGFPEIGFEKSVQNISNSEVINFYDKFISKAKSEIIIAGNIEIEYSAKLLNKYFKQGIFNSKLNIEQKNFPKYKTKYYFVHKADSAQSEIRVGHIAKKRNSEDYIPTKIMNSILGGQFSSRINLNLRERNGFTYGAGSAFHYYRDAALFEISTAVNIENTAEAISEIINEINGVKKNITSKEIDFAKSFLIKQYPARFETYIQMAKNIETLLIHDLPMEDLYNYTNKIETASESEIKLSAKNNLNLDELIILAVGNRNKIFNQLKSISDDIPAELTFYGEPVV